VTATPLHYHFIQLASAAIIILCAKAASPILGPILLATFIAAVAHPIVSWMMRHGAPKWFAILLIMFMLLDVGSLIALFLTSSLEGFQARWPGYQHRFELLLDQLGNSLEAAGIKDSRAALSDMFESRRVAIYVKAALTSASDTLGVGFLVLTTVAFMLPGAQQLSIDTVKAFGRKNKFKRNIALVLSALNKYTAVKSLTSLVTAAAVWALLWSLQIDFAILWAILAFILNFIPFLGTIIMMIPPMLVAAVQADSQTVVIVAIGFIVINTIIGNVWEPQLLGKGLGLSTLTVFLSMIFWGWLFGAIGIFLSAPLTTILTAILFSHPQTKSIAVLLGSAFTDSMDVGNDPDIPGEPTLRQADEPRTRKGTSST